MAVAMAGIGPDASGSEEGTVEELELDSLLGSLKSFDRGERIILGHFGTVQTLLSLILGQPVGVKLLDQHEEDGVIVRRVEFAAGDYALGLALSRIPRSKNRAYVIDDIVAGKLGLGQIIAAHKLSTWRKLSDLGKDDSSFWRTYRIVGPRVDLQICETFFRQPFEDMGWVRTGVMAGRGAAREGLRIG